MLEDGDMVVFKLYTTYGELCVMGCPLGFVVHVLCLVFALLRLECSLPLLHLHVAAACCTSAGSCAPDPSYYSFFCCKYVIVPVMRKHHHCSQTV